MILNHFVSDFDLKSFMYKVILILIWNYLTGDFTITCLLNHDPAGSLELSKPEEKVWTVKSGNSQVRYDIFIIKNKYQTILTKCHIAILSPLVAANRFVRHWPYVMHGSLGPYKSTTKRHLDRFSRFCVHCSNVSQYFSMGRTTPNSTLPHKKSGFPSNIWFLGPNPVSLLNGISIDSPVLHFSPVCSVRTHRHTDHATNDICSNRPHLCIAWLLVAEIWY